MARYFVVLGFVVAFWVMLQIANWLAGGPTTFDVAQIMMLPTIYLVGLTPALLAAWVDHALAKRGVSYRIALTALFGYAISYLPLIGAPWFSTACSTVSNTGTPCTCCHAGSPVRTL